MEHVQMQYLAKKGWEITLTAMRTRGSILHTFLKLKGLKFQEEVGLSEVPPPKIMFS